MTEGYLIPPEQLTAAAPVQIPPPPRDPYWYSPVFVLAPARSNSTVVSNMIGLHPELCGFPELSLFRFDTVGGLMTGRPGDKGPPALARIAGLLRALAQHHSGEQTDAAALEAARWLAARTTWSGAHVLDHMLALASPQIGFEKSPDNSNREEYLNRLALWYPRARFLHLTRHPITTASSMCKHWGHRNWWTIAPELFPQLCLGIWQHQHERIAAFTGSLPPDRWMRIRSEDALNAPDATLPAVCRWLGIDDGPESIDTMSHPERSLYARLGPESAPGGGDSTFFNAPERRLTELPEAFDAPEDWILDPWLYLRATHLASEFGYGNAAAQEES